MQRLRWLDGFRGLAALQVVLQHFACAFLPAIGTVDPTLIHYAWERPALFGPFRLLVDGNAAVFSFFALSGIALTYAFAPRPRAVVTSLARRIVRLGLPMAAALVLAACLQALGPGARPGALALPGSWLGAVGPVTAGAGELFHQIAVEGMFVGYRDESMFPATVVTSLHLAPLSASPDVPLWTLHIEFLGSVLIIGLTALRALAGRWAHLAACCALICATMTGPFLPFVLGHLAAPWLGRANGLAWQKILGALCLVAGAGACILWTKDFGAIARAELPAATLGPTLDAYHLQSMAGAVLIVAGVALLPVLQRLLTLHPFAWLGQLSFSLYLTHFPVLFTVIASCFFAIAGGLSYDVAALIAGIGGFATCLAVAMVFEKWIDRSSIWLSRRIGRLGPSVVSAAAKLGPAARAGRLSGQQR